MKDKIYKHTDRLPAGKATEDITKGCLVLEGGALRGVYTSGVLDALMEAGVNMECTVGVSAGALAGAYYVSGQIGLSGRCNLLHRHDKRYISFFHRRKWGGVFCFDYILNRPDDLPPLDWDEISRTEKKFVAAATSLETGEAAYFTKDNCCLLDGIKASASMPYLSKKVYIDGHPYLDGGCSAKIPYRYALQNGYDKMIIVRTRPAGWRYEEPKQDRKARMVYRKYPLFAYSLACSQETYNRDCDEILDLQRQGKAFVISPSRPVTVSRLEKDMNKLADLYFLGYEDAKSLLPDLMAYLNS